MSAVWWLAAHMDLAQLRLRPSEPMATACARNQKPTWVSRSLCRSRCDRGLNRARLGRHGHVRLPDDPPGMGLMMAGTAPWIEFAHHTIAPQHSFDGRVDMSVQTHDAAPAGVSRRLAARWPSAPRENGTMTILTWLADGAVVGRVFPRPTPRRRNL
jgi:hypothetical protein